MICVSSPVDAEGGLPAVNALPRIADRMGGDCGDSARLSLYESALSGRFGSSPALLHLFLDIEAGTGVEFALGIHFTNALEGGVNAITVEIADSTDLEGRLGPGAR